MSRKKISGNFGILRYMLLVRQSSQQQRSTKSINAALQSADLILFYLLETEL